MLTQSMMRKRIPNTTHNQRSQGGPSSHSSVEARYLNIGLRLDLLFCLYLFSEPFSSFIISFSFLPLYPYIIYSSLPFIYFYLFYLFLSFITFLGISFIYLQVYFLISNYTLLYISIILYLISFSFYWIKFFFLSISLLLFNYISKVDSNFYVFRGFLAQYTTW